jgi:type II secretory ATPase GspE/PulE/Tfp pilus assembly ATPase PilB-like protein
MVGEIRDHDTANIAIQAALTGHLVLSTLHTKSATETLERLFNMELAPYVIASSVDIIIAQRLVRKICPHCNEQYDASDTENEMIRYMMRNIGMEALVRMSKTGFKLHR